MQTNLIFFLKIAYMFMCFICDFAYFETVFAYFESEAEVIFFLPFYVQKLFQNMQNHK